MRRGRVVMMVAGVLFAAGAALAAKIEQKEIDARGFIYVAAPRASGRPQLREKPDPKAKVVGEVPFGVRLVHLKLAKKGEAVSWYRVVQAGVAEGWLAAADSSPAPPLPKLPVLPLPLSDSAKAAVEIKAPLTSAARGFDRRVAQYVKKKSAGEALDPTKARAWREGIAALDTLQRYVGSAFRDPPYEPGKLYPSASFPEGVYFVPGTYADRTASGRAAAANGFATAAKLIVPPAKLVLPPEEHGTNPGRLSFGLDTGSPRSDRALRALMRAADARAALGQALDSITARDERAIGAAAAVKVATESGGVLLADSELLLYVNQVGNLVALHGQRTGSPPRLKARRFFFGILRDEQPTAFSTPGGNVFVTTSLLRRLNSEAELAFVLGHEIAHVDEEHGLLAAKGSEVTQAVVKLWLEGDQAAGAQDLSLLFENASVFEKLADTLAGLAEGALRAAQEPGADVRGMSYVIAAGWDARAASDALDALDGVSADRKANLLQAEGVKGAAAGKTGFDRFQEMLRRVD